jgi:hydrogenase nickel incorporation protein HypA/HybF
MHEIGIANSILEAVRAEARLHPGHVPVKIAVRIGGLAAIDPEALRFGFETLARETGMESLQLEIELCPPRYSCSKCGSEFSASQFDSRCPKCGNERTQFLSGDQLELAYLEMEEHEPSTA